MTTIAPQPVGRGSLLELLAETLSITEQQHQRICTTYDDLGGWLKERANIPWDVAVYPQGSQRIGTTNQDPYTGHYDADVVIRVAVPKGSIIQRRLNQIVGGWLGGYVSARQAAAHPLAPASLRKGKRAWTLEYADGFHIDVLPVIPDDAGGNDRFDPSWLTDKELTRWQPTDPRGFATWFTDVSEAEREIVRLLKAAERKVDVTDLPDLAAKTTLQKVVQLLKRHRDHHFAGAEDGLSPPSIVITTLAGRAYAKRTPGGGPLHEVVDQVMPHLASSVERRQGLLWIPNPAYDEENYADRINGDRKRHDTLFDWIAAAELDMRLDTGDLRRAAASIDRGFGENLGARVVKRLGGSVQHTRSTGNLGSTAAGTLVENAVRPHSPNTFYGDAPDAPTSR